MKVLAWLLKAVIFFVLFAFALNNQGPMTLHFFFGTQWQGPVVLVVLSTFALGLLTGVLAMVPNWWRHRKDAKKRLLWLPDAIATAAAPVATTAYGAGPSTRSGPLTLPAELPFPPDMPAPRKPAK